MNYNNPGPRVRANKASNNIGHGVMISNYFNKQKDAVYDTTNFLYYHKSVLPKIKNSLKGRYEIP